MDELKTYSKTYRDLDERLKQLNADTADVRKERKEVEIALSVILAKPEFKPYEKLELADDGSVIRIQRPGEWSKGWSMSKTDLHEGLKAFFADKLHGLETENAHDICYKFLEKRQQAKQITTEFAFERTFPKKRKTT